MIYSSPLKTRIFKSHTPKLNWNVQEHILFGFWRPMSIYKRTALFLTIALFAALPVRAEEPPNPMSDFDQAVAQTLLDHPEILLAVFQKLQQQEEADKSAADEALIEQHYNDLFGAYDAHKPVLVEFVDYACGYCKAAFEIVHTLKNTDPELSVKTIQFPILGEGSTLAAAAALVIERSFTEHFDLFHETLMHLKAPLSERTIRIVLGELDLPTDIILSAANAEDIQNQIAQNRALAASLHISGTPGFVGRGRILRGMADAQTLHALATSSN